MEQNIYIYIIYRYYFSISWECHVIPTDERLPYSSIVSAGHGKHRRFGAGPQGTFRHPGGAIRNTEKEPKNQIKTMETHRKTIEKPYLK